MVEKLEVPVVLACQPIERRDRRDEPTAPPLAGAAAPA